MAAGGNVQNPGNTPEPDRLWDVLVVGGGPGGTATAFRAMELGLSVLVVDHDDLMKRIRDYSKDKLILPSFGGGDRVCFPDGGPMIQALHFEPIDKDEMCAVWKGHYQKNKVFTEIGVEFTGLDQQRDGSFRVLGWNHKTRSEQVNRAKYVVLAIGHGVPRRFNIPGNTEGIAFRLADPADYVSQPACVIGGGTSAAEAVIAISNAKIQAGDPSLVYWSYRGDRLPRVSKALADVFFEAYLGNGNIRYFPNSEPAAVVTADDHQDYLAIRIDRRHIPNRPAETTHFEFPKTACIACIGEDIPETLLNSIGIRLVEGGPKNKKRMVVTPFLESMRAGVFLAGDLLSQAYLCTEDFTADPAGFTEVIHRGNVKSALRDGVLVAEVIKQRVEGRSRIKLPDWLDREPQQVAPVSPGAAAGKAKAASLSDSLGPTPSSAQPGAFLLRVLPNGIVENEYPLFENRVTKIGREGCDISFPEDTMLDSHHATVSHVEGSYFLWDNSRSAGTFLRVPPASKRQLTVGDLIRAGKQFILICAKESRFWFNHYDLQGHQVSQQWLSEKAVVLGRESPDFTLDPNDKTLSRRHLALSVQDGGVIIKDLKSANGTYLRVRESIKLQNGDQFKIGFETLTFSDAGDVAPVMAPVVTPATRATPLPSPAPAPIAASAASRAAAAAVPSPAAAGATAGAAAGAITVTFEGLGKVCPARAGQTICEVAESNGIPLRTECHAGICGSDPVRILAGLENLENPPDGGEAETLEDLCNLVPGECRLACVARIKGPVTVKILG